MKDSLSDRAARLAELQTRRGGTFALAALLLAAASLPWIMQLGLDSGFTALLPSDKPSVQDLELTAERVGGINTLTVALQSKDTEALKRFATDLVPKLEALDNPHVHSVEWNIAAYEQFVYDHRHLYADVDDLREIRDELQIRLDYERLKHNPLYVSLEDPPGKPEELIERIEKQAKEGQQKMSKFPGGFYLDPKGDLLAIFVRTDLKGGNVGAIEELTGQIRAAARSLEPDTYAEDLSLSFAGSVMHALEEHSAIKDELTLATSLTIVLVLGVVLVFFRRIRAVPLLGFAVGVPVLVTFGIAEFLVDYLNTSTAFLGSIVLGNGVNPNIIWLARYFEERRTGRAVQEAITQTHRSTWPATITASLAAGFAYGSLMLTDFRGFRDFGIIGGIGMLLCWIGAYTVLPAAVALSERLRPLQGLTQGSNLYGRLFLSSIRTAPRALLAGSVVLTLASTYLVYVAVINDPLEYNFSNLRSVREGTTEVTQINKRINKFIGQNTDQSIAVLSNSPEQTQALQAELIRKRDEEGAPYGTVRSVFDLLPAEQEKKVPVIEEIREMLVDARKYAEGEQLEKIDKHIPPADIAPLTAQDLPEAVARSFTERDGSRETMLFVSNQKGGPSLWDGRYLVAWASSLRELRLPGGSRPPLAGRAPVFADMIEAVFADGPVAVGASLSATILLLLVSFRRFRDRVATLAALLLGILWMAGTMAAAGMKLNFLNFVAFPITFGNGADYGVNVMRRYDLEASGTPQDDEPVEHRAVRIAVQESGGAVILCSLTTIIGYSTLYVSANRALNSFGAAMAISEVTCLLSAVVTVPAFFWLRGTRRQRKATP